MNDTTHQGSTISKYIVETIDNDYNPYIPILPSSRLEKDLGIDSLDKVELIMSCEKEFSISIEDELVDGIITVADLSKIVTDKVATVLT